MKYVFGNWKANKNYSEVQSWISEFQSKPLEIFEGVVEIVICPPYPFITTLHEAFASTPWIKIGSQDISYYGAGRYTGEVPAHSLGDIVSYSIIGHSERRSNFNETNTIIDQKAQNALESGIEPLVLIRDGNDTIPSNVSFVCYEPSSAISTGEGNIVQHNVPVQDIIEQKSLLSIPADFKFIYGGSVTTDTIHEYARVKEIDGVLPGSASLDPEAFYHIARAFVELQN